MRWRWLDAACFAASLLALCLLAFMATMATAFGDELDLPVGPKWGRGPEPIPYSRFGPNPTTRVRLPGLVAEDENTLGPGSRGGPPSDVPAPTFYGEVIDVRGSIVYVLDRSGSMMNSDGQSLPRIVRARREVARSVAELDSRIRFNVLAFDDRIDWLWPELREATADAKVEAAAWLEGVSFRGATNTGAAGAAAVGQANTVVLLTDGRPTDPTPDPAEHRAQIRRFNTDAAVVHVFGLGVDDQARSFCQGVASDSGGNYADVQ